MRVVHQTRQGYFLAAAVQKFRARQSRAGGARFSSQKIPAHRGEKAKRATGPAVRSSWISHHRRAEQQRPKGVAVRRLFPRGPGGVHRAAAKIAKGLSATRSNLSRSKFRVRRKFARIVATNIRRILLLISSAAGLRLAGRRSFWWLGF